MPDGLLRAPLGPGPRRRRRRRGRPRGARSSARRRGSMKTRSMARRSSRGGGSPAAACIRRRSRAERPPPPPLARGAHRGVRPHATARRPPAIGATRTTSTSPWRTHVAWQTEAACAPSSWKSEGAPLERRREIDRRPPTRSSSRSSDERPRRARRRGTRDRARARRARDATSNASASAAERARASRRAQVLVRGGGRALDERGRRGGVVGVAQPAGT